MPMQANVMKVLSTPRDASGDRTELDASYPDRFLTCRELQHAWRRIGFYHANGEVVRALTCERCGTDRHDYWSPSGGILRRSYDYAEGYAIRGGERVTSLAVRMEVLDRVVVYDNADAMHDALFGKGGRRAAAG